MRTPLRFLLLAPALTLAACSLSLNVDGSDGGVPVDAGADAGHDGGASVDAGVDAGCLPPPCAAPPPGCHYEGATQCTCGTLVCTCTGPGPGLPCCVVDADCGASQHCVGEVCSPGGSFAGVCEADVASGQCWEDADCGSGTHCVGARVCPCGTSCLLADKPGTCTTQADCRTAGCDGGLACCDATGLCYNSACLACCM